MQCDLCKTDFKDLELAWFLLCGHGFHEECLDGALCQICGLRSDRLFRQMIELDFDQDVQESDEEHIQVQKHIQVQEQKQGHEFRSSDLGCFNVLDTRLVRKISKPLCLSDWINFYSCCSWYWTRPMNQFHRLKSANTFPLTYLQICLSRNDPVGVTWILKNRRHHMEGPEISLAIASSCKSTIACAAAINFEADTYKKAEHLATVIDPKVLLDQLIESQKYRRPFLRALAKRFSIPWFHGSGTRSDAELISALEKTLFIQGSGLLEHWSNSQ